VIESVASILGRSGPAFDVPQDIADRVIRGERDAVQEHLDTAAAALRDAGVATVQTMVAEGTPGPTIVEVAEREGCDAIVMSTHGHTGIRRAFLGSVANYVVHHAEGTAVLLVRPPTA
jgi:nucleotide-binding universal stress UspA family protein